MCFWCGKTGMKSRHKKIWQPLFGPQRNEIRKKISKTIDQNDSESLQNSITLPVLLTSKQKMKRKTCFCFPLDSNAEGVNTFKNKTPMTQTAQPPLRASSRSSSWNVNRNHQNVISIWFDLLFHILIFFLLCSSWRSEVFFGVSVLHSYEDVCDYPRRPYIDTTWTKKPSAPKPEGKTQQNGPGKPKNWL